MERAGSGVLSLWSILYHLNNYELTNRKPPGKNITHCVTFNGVRFPFWPWVDSKINKTKLVFIIPHIRS